MDDMKNYHNSDCYNESKGTIIIVNTLINKNRKRPHFSDASLLAIKITSN